VVVHESVAPAITAASDRAVIFAIEEVIGYSFHEQVHVAAKCSTKIIYVAPIGKGENQFLPPDGIVKWIQGMRLNVWIGKVI
jgi:hypothetical protein